MGKTYEKEDDARVTQLVNRSFRYTQNMTENMMDEVQNIVEESKFLDSLEMVKQESQKIATEVIEEFTDLLVEAEENRNPTVEKKIEEDTEVVLVENERDMVDIGEDNEEERAGFVELVREALDTTFDFGNIAVCSMHCLASEVAQNENAQFIKQNGEQVTDLVQTLSSDIIAFDGNWTTKQDEERVQAVEVGFDGNKDTIVTSCPIESSFLVPEERAIESVHVVPVTPPSTPLDSKKRKKKAPLKRRVSVRNPFKSTRVSI